MADTQPIFSVCLLCCNQGAYLEEAIESALAQDFEASEIIVADDASSDKSPSIIRQYAQRHPGRVHPLFSESRMGCALNAHSALRACRGDYIAFLAADDLFLPGKLAAQARLFESDPTIALTYHGVEVFANGTGNTLALMDVNPEDVMHSAADLLQKGGIRNGCSVAIRRSAMPARGMDNRLNAMSDWLFQIEVAMMGRVAWVPKIFGRYRRHASNMTNRFSEFSRETETMLQILKAEYPSRMDLKYAASFMEQGVVGRTSRAY